GQLLCSVGFLLLNFAWGAATAHLSKDGLRDAPGFWCTASSFSGGGDLLRHLHALAEAESKINELLPHHRKFNDLKTQLELKLHDVSLSENRAKQNEHHKVMQLSELVKKIEEELGAAKSAIKKKQLLCLLQNRIMIMSNPNSILPEGRYKNALQIPVIAEKQQGIQYMISEANVVRKGLENKLICFV
ncbi:structural maintenance of chromosomes protein, partial [Striga asiatica]